MTQTTTTPEPSDLMTAQQRLMLRRNLQQRLRLQAEDLLRAFEDQAPPKTYAEVERAAKALLAINKVLTLVYADQPFDDKLPVADTAPNYVPGIDPEQHAAWRKVLDAKLAEVSAARQAYIDKRRGSVMKMG